MGFEQYSRNDFYAVHGSYTFNTASNNIFLTTPPRYTPKSQSFQLRFLEITTVGVPAVTNRQYVKNTNI